MKNLNDLFSFEKRKRLSRIELQRLFEEFVRTEEQRLYRLANSITRCPHAAQDVLQESLITLYDHLYGKDLDGNIKAWLTKVVINNGLQHLRRTRTAAAAHSAAMKEKPTTNCFESQLDYNEKRELVWAHIQELPGRLKSVLLRRLIDGLTYDRIAEELSISTKTAERYYYKALDKIRRVISEKGRSWGTSD